MAKFVVLYIQTCLSISLFSEMNQTGNCMSGPLMMYLLITSRKVCIQVSIFSITCIQVLCPNHPYILEVSINLPHTNISFMLLLEKQQKLVLVILSYNTVLPKGNSSRQKHKHSLISIWFIFLRS